MRLSSIERIAGKAKIKPLLFLAAVLVLLAAGRFIHIQRFLTYTLEWIDHLGMWGPVIFIGIYVLASVFFIPGSALTLGAGILFGVVVGSVAVSIGSTLGATAAFIVGRYFARDWVTHKIEGHARFKAIDRAVADEGWKIVGLTRLSPVFPFNMLNYVYGLTRVSLRDYVLASWVGMMPGTVMYVYIGSLAGRLAELSTARHSRTPAEWTIYAVGLLATVAVTFLVTRIAGKAIAKRVA